MIGSRKRSNSRALGRPGSGVANDAAAWVGTHRGAEEERRGLVFDDEAGTGAIRDPAVVDEARGVAGETHAGAVGRSPRRRAAAREAAVLERDTAAHDAHHVDRLVAGRPRAEAEGDALDGERPVSR